MYNLNKTEIMGCPCHYFETEKIAFDGVQNLLLAKTGGYSVAINAEKIMLYIRNEKFRAIIDNSSLPSPDGTGALMGMRLLHSKRSIKLDLPKLVLNIANTNALKLFVLGATEEVNSEAVNQIVLKYPSIKVTGRMNGYFKNDDEVLQALKSASPDIVLLALGSPKQENLAVNLKDELPGIFYVGCGGALDVLAGKVKRAPTFFINNNLEWFYRLAQSPSRIKRQKILPVFLVRLIATYLRNKFN